MSTQHTRYLRNALESPLTLQDTVDRTVKTILEHLSIDDFDFIACRGISGLVVASPVSYLLDKQLVIVRKTTKDSHATYMVEGLPLHDNQKYIIVDDLISTGKTFQTIHEKINTQCKCELVGAYCYHHHEWQSQGSLWFVK